MRTEQLKRDVKISQLQARLAKNRAKAAKYQTRASSQSMVMNAIIGAPKKEMQQMPKKKKKRRDDDDYIPTRRPSPWDFY